MNFCCETTPAGRPSKWSRETWRRQSAASAAGALIVGLCAAHWGCSGNQDKPPSLPSQTASPVASPDSTVSEQEPRPEPPPPPEPRGTTERDRNRSELTIVIDEGDPNADRPSLVEASRAERKRRQETRPATIVITDENLQESATGVLTEAAPDNQIDLQKDSADSRSADGELTGNGPEGPPPAGDPRAEDYWRGRALQARLAWREASGEIERLQGTVNQLRRRFYEEDDPYYRDTQIKPAWDRALDRLQDARALALAASEELDEVIEEGRRAGALPGWLREGIDLEPERDRPRRGEPEEYEIGEPAVYEPDGDEDGS